TAVNQQNVILPSGTAKIGSLEYNVLMNGSPDVITGLNDLPVKKVNGAMVYLRDVAHVRDGYVPQTSMVLTNGTKGALLPILKALGGMALAVGILVDDATVEVENFHRQHAMGKPVLRAILDGAAEIAVPALVSTLCICIVFLPVTLIAGVAKSLFIPLAMSVVFAMLTSYFLSRTLVPTLVRYLLANEKPGGETGGRNPIAWMSRRVERGFERRS